MIKALQQTIVFAGCISPDEPGSIKVLRNHSYKIHLIPSLDLMDYYLKSDPSVKLVIFDLDHQDLGQIDNIANEVENKFELPVLYMATVVSSEVYDLILKTPDRCLIPRSEEGYFLLSAVEACICKHRHRMQQRAELEIMKQATEQMRDKLEKLSCPEIELIDFELDDIIETGTIQSLMDSFYELTKIGIGIIDTKGKVLVATGWQDICTQFHRKNPETLQNCIYSDTVLSEDTPVGTYKMYKCKNNLWDISTPIMAGKRIVGWVFLGQFFFEDENPEYSFFIRQAQKYGFNTEEYISALDRVPRWSRDKVNAVMQFYAKLTQIFAQMSYNNIRLAKTLKEKDILVRQKKNGRASVPGSDRPDAGGLVGGR